MPTAGADLLDAPHFVAAHVALAQAFALLETERDARGWRVADTGLAAAEHYRLRHGHAGLPVLVKYAQGLGMTVTLALAPAQEG